MKFKIFEKINKKTPQWIKNIEITGDTIVAFMALVFGIYATFKDNFASPDIKTYYPEVINFMPYKDEVDFIVTMNFVNEEPALGVVRKVEATLTDSLGHLWAKAPWIWFSRNEREVEAENKFSTVFIKENDVYPIILNGKQEQWKNILFAVFKSLPKDRNQKTYYGKMLIEFKVHFDKGKPLTEKFCFNIPQIPKYDSVDKLKLFKVND